jgi:hypothetical protein
MRNGINRFNGSYRQNINQCPKLRQGLNGAESVAGQTGQFLEFMAASIELK